MRIDRRGFIVTFGVGALAACGNNGSNSQPGSSGGTGGSSPSSGGPPLTVDFSGLIAVARPKAASDPLDFLLVDGNATLSMPHDPFLVIEKAIVASANPPTTPGMDRVYKAKLCTFWNLKDYQLAFDSSGSGISAVTGHRGTAPTPGPGEEDDVTWMAEMSKIPGIGAVNLNPTCTAADPRPAKVAARVRCTSGNFQSRFDPIWKDRIFQFKNGAAAPYSQPLGMPQLVVNATQPATLNLTPFGASTPTTTIKLTNGAHSIVILNEPSSLPGSCTTADDFTHLKHFAAFYQLASPVPATQPIPECTGTNCPVCDTSKPFHESDYVYCPPAQF